MKKNIITRLFIISISLLYLSCNTEHNRAVILENEKDPQIYEIITPDSENYHSNISDESSDYLILFYIAGDNNYNDIFYKKMIDIGKGINRIRMKDNITPKKGFSKVQAFVLWDGANTNIKNTNETFDHFLPNSKLFSAKYPDSKNSDEWFSDLSLIYTDLSSQVDFLGNTNEINTGSESALKDYLIWINSKYAAQKTILVLCGLGDGPFGNYPRSSQMDNSSGKDFLTAKEIGHALSESGYTNKKLDLLILDNSYSSSVEDLYELQNSVNSIIASPGETPNSGINYSFLIKSLKENTSIYSLGNDIVNTYASLYFLDSDLDTKQLSSMGSASISFIDTNYLSELNEKINTFSEYLIETKDSKKIAIDNSRYSFFDSLKSGTGIPYNFLSTNESLPKFTNENTMLYRCTFRIDYEDKGYSGGHFFTYDLPYFCAAMNIAAQKHGSIEIQNLTKNIIDTVDKMIIASWKNGNDTLEGIYKSDIYSTFNNYKKRNIFGITITGSAKQHYFQDKSLFYQPYQFSDFDFKNDSFWTVLLKELYPEQFTE